MFDQFKRWYIGEWLKDNVSFDVSPELFQIQVKEDFVKWARKTGGNGS